MLILYVKFLKLMKETFENNVEINFEVHINFENLVKFSFVLHCICVGITTSTILAHSIFFSVLRIGQGDNDCHIPVFFPCCLSFSGDLAAKSRQMSYRKSGQTVG